MANAPNLVARARVMADLVGSDFLLPLEWNDLLSDAARAMWADITKVNKDFRNNVMLFAIASTASNFTVFPWDFREVRFVRRNPGTQSQLILNKLGQRSGSTQFEPSYRIQDRNLYIEPAVNSVCPTYDLVYVPQPANFTADFVVRIARGRDLPATATAGAGIGKTITGNVNGAVPPQDGVAPVLGDRMLIVETNSAADLTPRDFGIYTFTNLGSAGTKWVLTRATDCDEASPSEIRSGIVATATEGTANTGRPFQLATFTGPVDNVTTGSQNWLESLIDAELDPWSEYLVLHTAIKALCKEESTEQASDLLRLFDPNGDGKQGIRGALMGWAAGQRSADPDVVEDVRGSRRARGNWIID